MTDTGSRHRYMSFAMDGAAWREVPVPLREMRAVSRLARALAEDSHRCEPAELSLWGLPGPGEAARMTCLGERLLALDRVRLRRLRVEPGCSADLGALLSALVKRSDRAGPLQLQLGGNDVAGLLPALAEVLLELELDELDLRCCSLPPAFDSQLAARIGAPRGLRRLDLAFNGIRFDAALVRAVLGDPRLSALEELRLGGDALVDEGGDARAVRVERMLLHEEGGRRARNSVDAGGDAALGEALSAGLRRLAVLDLRGCFSSFDESALGRIVATPPAWTCRASLRELHVDHVPYEVARLHLAAALRALPALERLSLSFDTLAARGEAGPAFEALLGLSALRTLALSFDTFALVVGGRVRASGKNIAWPPRLAAFSINCVDALSMTGLPRSTQSLKVVESFLMREDAVAAIAELPGLRALTVDVMASELGAGYIADLLRRLPALRALTLLPITFAYNIMPTWSDAAIGTLADAVATLRLSELVLSGLHGVSAAFARALICRVLGKDAEALGGLERIECPHRCFFPDSNGEGLRALRAMPALRRVRLSVDSAASFGAFGAITPRSSRRVELRFPPRNLEELARQLRAAAELAE